MRAEARELRITDPGAALFLLDRYRSSFVVPFLGRECSLVEAVRALGLGKSRMSYWAWRMLELVEVVRVEKRSRFHVPVYRSVADVFTFPIELVPAESDEALLTI